MTTFLAACMPQQRAYRIAMLIDAATCKGLSRANQAKGRTGTDAESETANTYNRGLLIHDPYACCIIA